MNRRGLGRGLDALMPDVTPNDTDRIAMLGIGDIDPNPNQPRQKFDQASLKELADSIRQMGVLQPILVGEADGRYRIIAGERRWRAARMAEQKEIPCIVRDMNEVQRMEAALIENLQREDLNPMEEAGAVRSLMVECGLTQEGAAERLGRSRPALANLLRLLTLPEKVAVLVREDRISAGHARALAAIEDERICETLAQRAVAEGLSVRQIEQLARDARDAGERIPTKPLKDKRIPEFSELEDRLRKAFGMRAQVAGTLEKGKITLQYGTRAELEYLFDMVGGKNE
ncbi:MAG: ParB/RepB/Spo0J family partition protein [Clostridia bacterium]|nr:ParB/RepB/Spo0J family partition protein [Clostridia bacterium]